LKPTDATFEIIRTADRQVVLRGVYYGQHSDTFSSLVDSFQSIAQNFYGNHAFAPIGPARTEESGNRSLYLQVFDIIDESLRVEEILEWSRDVARQHFLTPQQYNQLLRKNAV